VTTTTSATTAPARLAYRELGLLAEGGMALVMRAVSEPDGVDVVIKRVRPPLCFDAAFLRLFRDEGALHAALEHEHIVRLLDQGEDEAGPFLVFEHVDGTDLGALLERARADGAPLDVELVLAIAIPVAAALAFVHAASRDGEPLSAVHRDISPANILLCEDGGVKLADFGVATSTLKTEATVAGELKGKFAYMAPEQTRGGSITPAADLFALGVVLWECLANRRLFDAPTDADIVQQVRHSDVPRLDDASVRAPVEGPLADLIATMLEKDPSRRPASAKVVYDALQQIALERGLDDGLRRHVARAVRAAPRRAVTPVAPDVPRRRTQRVVGLATADTVRRLPSSVGGRVGLVAAAVAAVVVVVVVAAGSGATDQPPPVALHVTPPPVTLPPAIGTAIDPATTTPAPTPAPAPPPVIMAQPPPAPSPPPTTKPRDGTPRTTTPAPTIPSTPPPPAPAPAPAVVADGFGRVSITSEPWARVLIDGVEAAKETPLLGFSLRAGVHEVTLENPVVGLKKTVTITVAKDEHLRRFVDLQRP